MSINGTAFERLRVALEQSGGRVTGNGSRLSAQCPAHDDGRASLSVTGIQGQTLVHCHAGCQIEDVLGAVGLRLSDLFDEPRGVDYRYDDGRIVHRTPDKQFWQRGNTKTGALYRLKEVRAAVAAGQAVWVCEGEKDCHALETLGVTATCSAMGATNAARADWTPLRGAKVVLVPDRDQSGGRYARDVHRILSRLDTSIEIRLAAAGKDPADHVAAGHGIGEFVPAELPPDPDVVGNPDGAPLGESGGGNLSAEEYEARRYQQVVDDEYLKLRAREDARRRLRAQQTGLRSGKPAPDLLADLLAEPDIEATYLIDRLWPANGRVLWSAQFKAGKTTGVGNILRSLVDGDPFLGEFDVTPLDRRRVAVLDTEMDRNTLRRWLRDQAIRNTTSVISYSLRGRLSSLDLLDADVRRTWSAELGELGVGVVILDCLRPVLDSLGLEENTDAGRFLVAFDTMLNEADVAEGMVVHHMGHNGERSRGSSRLRDWPDAEWKLVREQTDEDDPSAPRYFSAYGRDVEVPESALAYDPHTRHLTLSGAGSRKQAAGRAVVPAVLALLDDAPEGLSGRQIEDALMANGEKRQAVRAALKFAVGDRSVHTAPGPRRATIYTVSDPSEPVRRSAPPVRQRAESECASAPIGGALHSLPADGSEPTSDGGALTCPQCGREAERLITYPGGSQYCPRCAYPGEPEEADE